MEKKKIIGRDISILHRHKNRYGDTVFKEFNLNNTQAEALLYLNRFPGANLKEINNYFMINKASITKIVNHLEISGYVSRRYNKQDKRECGVYLTDSGIELIPELINRLQKWESKLLSNISVSDVDKLRDLLFQMVENITVMGLT